MTTSLTLSKQQPIEPMSEMVHYIMR